MVQLVIFQLGGGNFGMDIANVQVIVRIPELIYIPQSPDFNS